MSDEITNAPVVSALIAELGVDDAAAREIVAVLRNQEALEALRGRDLRGLAVRIDPDAEPAPKASLTIDDGEGPRDTGVTLCLIYDDLATWRTGGIRATLGKTSASA